MFHVPGFGSRCSVAFAAGLLSLTMAGCGGGSSPAAVGSPSLSSSPSALTFANFASASQTVTLNAANVSGLTVTDASCKNIVSVAQKGTTVPALYTIAPINPGSCSLVFTGGGLTATTVITVGGQAVQEVSFTQTSSPYTATVPLTYSVTNPNPVAMNVFYYLYNCSNIPNVQSVCEQPGVANSGYLTGWTGFLTIGANQTIQNVISLTPPIGYLAAASVFFQAEMVGSGYTKTNPPPYASP